MQWKALSPDGFQEGFFQSQWELIGKDIFYDVIRVKQGGNLDNGLNHTLTSLIPKISHHVNIKNFRPITLCMVIYKIVAKLIANIFKSILPSLVRPNQTSFVSERKITDNIIIAQEVMHSMCIKKGRECFFTLKVDLEKAYDRICWAFLRHTNRSRVALQYDTNHYDLCVLCDHAVGMESFLIASDHQEV